MKIDESSQKAILLAEVGALIHDLGKLHKFFIDNKTPEGESIYGDYKHGNVLEWDSFSDDTILQDKASKLKKLLEDTYIPYKDRKFSLYSIMKEHHLRHNNDHNDINPFVNLVVASDKFDSEEDRGGASDRQSICMTYFSNAFGHEKEMLLSSKEDFEKERRNAYDLIIDLLNDYTIDKLKRRLKEFKRELREHFSKSLGMTARAANDVSLWEHSYMTACITKALLHQSIIEGYSLVEDTRIIERKPFKILSIYWNFFGFISQSHKIPDIRGRTKELELLKQDIKNLIEIEFLLGNCIYEDEYGLCFLIPGSFDCEGIIKEKIYEIFNDERLNGILIPYIYVTDRGSYLSKLLPEAIKEMKKERETDFKPKWKENWNKNQENKELICTVCGKGMYLEGDKETLCATCKKIRKMGREKEGVQTLFMDEISWNGEFYENVSLFILSFDLDRWLSGENIRTLFVRKYDEEYIKLLRDYYRKGEDIIGNFVRQGALLGWIKKEAEEAKERAYKDIDNCIGQYIASDDFSKNYLKNFLPIFRKIKSSLDSNSAKKSKGHLNELNNEYFRIKMTMERIEDRILNPKYKNKEKDIIKKSNDLNEIKERIFVKNPSPSRLMRIWNNTQEFFCELENSICEIAFKVDRPIITAKDFDGNIADKGAYKLKIISDSERVDASGFFKDGKLYIVTPHVNTLIKDKDVKVKVADPSLEFPKCKLEGSVTLRACRTISISPNAFMFLIPASKTPVLLRQIKKEYIEKFGKVYGKLPLDINIIFFKKKTPFYTLIDSARKFINSKRSAIEKHELYDNVKSDDNAIVKTHVGETEIPFRLGNGEIDFYTPYFMVKNEKDALGAKNCNQKHVLNLKKSDEIETYPSHFDFIFVDSNTRRFDICFVNRKRPHTIFSQGIRPYYLEDIDEFKKIWEILQSNCDNSQLSNFESLLLSRMEEWNLKTCTDLKKTEEFKNLLGASIRNILGINERDEFSIIFNSVVSGIFFDVKELYHTILKSKLGGR